VPELAASRVVTPTGVEGPGVVVVDGGRIAAVEPATGTVPDRTLVPGFVDLQVNGIDDVDVATARDGEWDRLDQLLLAQGTTTWCPTLVTSALDAYGPALDRIAAAQARGGGPIPSIAGAHLEGPFLGGAPGAHDPELIIPVDLRWLAGLRPVVRLVTLAPEADGALDAVKSLERRGVVVALGHSTSTFEQALEAIEAGAWLVTHVFNGMTPLHHRRPGLVGAALSDRRVTVSLIADNVHLHPSLVRLAFAAKGRGRVALVTDSVAWRAGSAGPIALRFVDGAARLADGTLAGSVLTMDGAVRNAAGAGVGLADAVHAASTTPAAVLGLTDRGSIAPGLRADLVALTPALEVEQVWIAGEPAIGGVGR
jgi:N-acetylglucosamine-6-phosphate deacetylase